MRVRSLLALCVAFTISVADGSASAGAENTLAKKIAQFERRIAENPGDYLSRTLLAQLYAKEATISGRLSRTKDALREAKAALASREDHIPALLLAGNSELALHNFSAAQTYADRVLTKDSNHFGALALKTDVLLELGNVSESKALLTRLEAESPDDPAVAARQARLSLVAGRVKEAAAAFERAADLADESEEDPDVLAWYHVQVGETNFLQGRFDAARDAYGRAASLAPNAFSVQVHLAELAGAEKQFDKAGTMLRLLASSTSRPDILQALGDLASAQGEIQEASRWYERAEASFRSSLDSGESMFLHHLAHFYADSLPKPDKAVEYAVKDLALRKTPAAYDLAAWALFKAARFDEAQEMMDRALTSDTEDAGLLYHAGMIAGALGNSTKAKELLARSAKNNPKYSSFHLHR